jgi:multidrug efflux system membrane fusion protein
MAGMTVVPTASVQRGPNGAFVYALDEDRAVLKPVTVGRQTETLAVITAGIAPGERVVTTGFARLTDGDRVRVADPVTPAPSAAPIGARPPGSDGEARETPRERRRRPEAQTSSTEPAPPRAGPGQGADGAGPGRAEPRGEGQRRAGRGEGRQGERQEPRPGSP